MSIAQSVVHPLGGGPTFKHREYVEGDLITPIAAPLHLLDTQALQRALEAMLVGNCVGFSLQLRHRGRTVIDRSWNFARTPTDGTQMWSGATTMHIASLSKLFTAIALVRCLDSHAISVDGLIHSWLPKDWTLGPRVDQLSFRHLLTHKSGLNFADASSDGRIHFMRSQLAAGTAHIGKLAYRNVNYTLCRLLLYRIERHYAAGSSGFTLPFVGGPHVITDIDLPMTDAVLDESSIATYESYLQEHVLSPAGVAGPSLLAPADTAWQYAAFDSATGKAPAGWRADAGSIGWFMSANQVLRVMAAFRRTGQIVSRQRAGEILRAQFGIDQCKATPMGPVYAKGGYWDADGGVQFSNAFFMSNDMELVILVNSPMRNVGADIQTGTIEAIHAAMRPYWLVKLLSSVVGAISGFRP